MIEVFGHQVNPGEKAYFTVPVGQLSHQAVIEIPVIVVVGKKEGTVLWVNGTVHGDELNGSYAAWELSREPVSYTHLDVYKRQPQRFAFAV